MDEKGSIYGNRLAEPLTPREVDILSLLAENLSDREIAVKLSLALNSVKWYTRQIYDKLGVDNRREAAGLAKELGLVGHAEVKVPAAQPAARLPRQLSTFIGREKEIARVADLLMDHPLVTLTGTGGVGKTRLSLAVAEHLLPLFGEKVWFVELASLSDPDLIWQTLADALQVRESSGSALLNTVRQRLEGIQGLLVIDNCEHLIDASAEVVSQLLQTSTRLRILTSSRESLGLPGELIFKVPSLAFPSADEDTSLESLLEFDSVRLFIDRARAVDPDFSITSQQARFIAQICRRLDGIPLAIELAASRVASLDLEQVAARLDGMFRLLSGSSRSMVDRHRTLRSTIDWSYQLLTGEERLLFCRLAVFVGSWTLEAAEQVCSGGGLAKENILNLLSQLVNKSMVVTVFDRNRQMRYRFPETIRQYAIEKLMDSGESMLLRERHAGWFMEIVKVIENGFLLTNIYQWQNKYEPEIDNFRAAMDWLLGNGQDTNAALRSAIASMFYFDSQGNWSEALSWLNRALSQNREQYPLSALQIYAMIKLVEINNNLSTQEALNELGKILGYCDQLGEAGRFEKGKALSAMAWRTAIGVGDMQKALEYANEADLIFRQMGEPAHGFLLGLLVAKSYIYLCLEDLEQAEVFEEEFRQIAAAYNIQEFQCYGGPMRGDIALKRGKYEQACEIYMELLELHRQVGNKGGIANMMKKLGNVERARGNEKAAIFYHQECLKTELAELVAEIETMLHYFECLAFDEALYARKLPQAEAHRRLLRAALIFGFNNGERNRRKIPPFFEHQAEYERTIQLLNECLRPEEFQAAWDQGEKMDMKAAVQFALEG